MAFDCVTRTMLWIGWTAARTPAHGEARNLEDVPADSTADRAQDKGGSQPK